MLTPVVENILFHGVTTNLVISKILYKILKTQKSPRTSQYDFVNFTPDSREIKSHFYLKVQTVKWWYLVLL